MVLVADAHTPLTRVDLGTSPCAWSEVMEKKEQESRTINMVLQNLALLDN